MSKKGAVQQAADEVNGMDEKYLGRIIKEIVWFLERANQAREEQQKNKELTEDKEKDNIPSVGDIDLFIRELHGESRGKVAEQDERAAEKVEQTLTENEKQTSNIPEKDKLQKDDGMER